MIRSVVVSLWLGCSKFQWVRLSFKYFLVILNHHLHDYIAELDVQDGRHSLLGWS